MTNMINFQLLATIIIFLNFIMNDAHASELVYTPQNPSFGGNPLNGSVLLNNAQRQNKFQEQPQSTDQSALQEFNERLQRSVLNQLTNSIASNFVDDDGNLIPGQTLTDDFIVTIVDQGDGSISITTTDRFTGESTEFTVQANNL